MNLSSLDQAILWHPFTQQKTANPPIPIVSGKGAILYDESGNSYLDAISSWWMNLHGHAHPYIAERLYAQALRLEHVIFANFTHQPAVELAQRLLNKLPDNQKRVFYTDNGSSAVEVGLKMCIQYWHNRKEPRKKLLALENGYHGDTFGAMSVGARSDFSRPFQDWLFEVEFLDANAPDVVEKLAQILEKELVAGFVFEPLVQGAGGMRMYPAETLQKLVKMCQHKGVICIADEVMTGFYRTGKFLASEWAEIQPDIICLSKGLTGGNLPLGATTCTAQIFDAFWDDDRAKSLLHGHSCTANPLACTAALASLDLLEMADCQANIQRIIASNQEFLDILKNQYPQAQNPRQKGVILAFEVANIPQIPNHVWDFFIQKGLILRPLGNTIYLLPPYCITQAQLAQIYAGMLDFLQEIQSSAHQNITHELYP